MLDDLGMVERGHLRAQRSPLMLDDLGELTGGEATGGEVMLDLLGQLEALDLGELMLDDRGRRHLRGDGR